MIEGKPLAPLKDAPARHYCRTVVTIREPGNPPPLSTPKLLGCSGGASHRWELGLVSLAQREGGGN